MHKGSPASLIPSRAPLSGAELGGGQKGCPEQGPDLMGTEGWWVSTLHPRIFVGEEEKRSRGALHGAGTARGAGAGGRSEKR